MATRKQYSAEYLFEANRSWRLICLSLFHQAICFAVIARPSDYE